MILVKGGLCEYVGGRLVKWQWVVTPGLDTSQGDFPHD